MLHPIFSYVKVPRKQTNVRPKMISSLEVYKAIYHSTSEDTNIEDHEQQVKRVLEDSEAKGIEENNDLSKFDKLGML